MPKTLAEHLTDCGAETGLMIGRHSPAVAVLRQALAADSTLIAEAHALIETGAPFAERDHLTRWRNSLLRQALDPKHVG